MRHYFQRERLCTLVLLLCLTISAWSQNSTTSEAVVVTGKKITKDEAKRNAQQAIDAQRLVVATQKSLITAKGNEIDAAQRAFDARRARYLAEQERIAHKDAVVATRESCLANLLADCLMQCGPNIINDYQGYRNQPNEKMDIESFQFSKKLMRTLQSCYYLAHQERVSTFMDSKDRAAFKAHVKETFEVYFIGGKDRLSNPVEGTFSKHFHPKNLAAAFDESSPIAKKYIDELEKLEWAQSKTVRVAKAMPPEFYLGWQRFEEECGMPITYTLKGERKKERIPEVKRQEEEAKALREDYLHIEELKAQKKVLEQDLIPMVEQLQSLMDRYFNRYKQQY